MNIDELSSSAAVLQASVNVDPKLETVLCTKALLVLVMVEFVVAVASAMTLPPLKILPAMLSMNSGARWASRGNAMRRSMAEGSRDELFGLSMTLSSVGSPGVQDVYPLSTLTRSTAAHMLASREGCFYRSFLWDGSRSSDMAFSARQQLSSRYQADTPWIGIWYEKEDKHIHMCLQPVSCALLHRFTRAGVLAEARSGMTQAILSRSLLWYARDLTFTHISTQIFWSKGLT